MKELKVPLQLDPTGKLATVETPGDVYRQHVFSVVATNPGERVMRGNYGVPTRAFLFRPVDLAEVELQDKIRTALSRWEPEVDVRSIKTRDTDEDGLVHIEVFFSPRTTLNEQAEIQQALIEIGGEVTTSHE